MKINKKNAQKWADALRSGKYKQTIGTLQDSKGYCCLGVACKIFIPKKEQQYKHSVLYGKLPHNQHNSPLWLNEINQDLFDKTNITFSNLNDLDYYNFNEIADIIELVYVHKAI